MPTDIMETLRAETLREMDERGWSKAELARRARVPESRIKDVLSEKSKHPQIDTVAAIAGAFDRTVSDMIGEASTVQRAEPPAMSEERLGELIAEAAEDILTFVQEEGFKDGPQSIAQQIAEVFAQMAEAERLRERPLRATFEGNVVELPRRRQPG